MNDVLNDIEVAAILDCEPKTVHAKARDGVLPAIKFGRSWRFPREALMQTLNAMALANKPARREPVAVFVGTPVKHSRRRVLPVLPTLTSAVP